MSSIVSDSEGLDISFNADPVEIVMPEYKKIEKEDNQDELQEIETLIRANMELCCEIFRDIQVIKYFLCIKLKSKDNIMKLKKLNQITNPKDENNNKLEENIKRILNLLKFKKNTIIDHSIFELAVLSKCFSQNNFNELNKFTINKPVEVFGEKIREFCNNVFKHTNKTEHFTDFEKTVDYVCENLVRCIKKVEKSNKV